MLTLALAEEGFEVISGWDSEVAQFFRSVKLKKLSESDPKDVAEAPAAFSDPKFFRLLVSEREDHAPDICTASNC
jgi:hypothetical protein